LSWSAQTPDKIMLAAHHLLGPFWKRRDTYQVEFAPGSRWALTYHARLTESTSIQLQKSFQQVALLNSCASYTLPRIVCHPQLDLPQAALIGISQQRLRTTQTRTAAAYRTYQEREPDPGLRTEPFGPIVSTATGTASPATQVFDLELWHSALNHLQSRKHPQRRDINSNADIQVLMSCNNNGF
jgi:hypothetical protein